MTLEIKNYDAFFLTLAIGLHIVFLSIKLNPELIRKLEKLDNAFIVDLYNREVVSTSRSSDDDIEGIKARYFGEFKNRVKKETRASRTGRFKDSDIFPGNLGEGISQYSMSPNYLDNNIVEGSRTLLNTDPVYYASFVNRVADEIYESWVRYAELSLNQIYMSGRKLKANIYITKLSVTMDREGNVLSISVLKSSGIPEFDESTKLAFWDKEPFPNPPLQMFSGKDFAKFIYEFYIELKDSAFLIVPML